MSRTLNVVRLQLINRQTYIWLPLIILGGSLAIALAIYGILAGSGLPGPFYGGGAQAPLWYFLIVGVYALTLSFPFSQAMSITRREFYLGTLLTAGLTSLILAAIFVVGGLFEEATGGWWINGWFFRLDWIWASGPAGAGLFYFAVASLFFVVGFWTATIYKRWGSLGLTIALVGVGLLLVAVLFVVGLGNAWVAFFTWLAELGPVGVALWSLVLIAVLAGFSYLTLRRTIP
ncbi:hypothetical protein ACFC1I_06625 [Microbacterium sp. NPDC056044]|uniref:hypothetical protein n=1 Tax=Microbacterium sp. NPDC056044 TaxID=3345690 RepID=UPI0035E08E22